MIRVRNWMPSGGSMIAAEESHDLAMLLLNVEGEMEMVM